MNMCLNGHDKDVTGVGGKARYCKMCKRNSSRASAQRFRAHSGQVMWKCGALPMEPLVDFLNIRNASINSLPTTLGRAYHRSVVRGSCTFNIGDSIAIHFGVHPSAIWGSAWFAEAEETQDA